MYWQKTKYKQNVLKQNSNVFVLNKLDRRWLGMDNEKLNSNTKEKRVLDSVEAAQYLGISYWLIRKLVREKKIPYYKQNWI